MSDELTEMEAPNVEEEAPQEPEAPDPVALKEKALAEREAKLEARAAELQRLSSDLGRERAKVAEQPKPAEAEYEFTAEQKRMFSAYLKETTGLSPEELARNARMSQQSMVAQMNRIANDFHAANKDITPDTVADVLYEYGLDPNTIATPEQLASSLKLVKDVLDSRDVDKKVDTEVQKRLAELTKDGGEIVEVKPKKGAPIEGKRSLEDAIDDPNLSMFERLELAAKLNYE